MTDLPNQHAADALPYAAAPPSLGSAAPPRAETEAPAIRLEKTNHGATRPAATVYSAEWPKITHTLAYPVLLTAGADPIREIVIPEPDLETMERVLGAVEKLGLTAEQEIRLSVRHIRPLLVAFTGIPDDTIRRIHFRDVNGLAEKLAPLLEGLAT